MPQFTTLTEFYAWLSVNTTEGTEYYEKAKACYGADAQATEANKALLQTFLKNYLDENSDGFKSIMQSFDSGEDSITTTIDDEQNDRIKATFTNASLLWTHG